MSRYLVPVATVATIGAIALAAEMQSPGFWALIFAGVLHGIGMALESYVTIAVIAGFLICLGYMICRVIHAPAIRDARIERRHEHRIIALRKRESELTAQLRAEARWNS